MEAGPFQPASGVICRRARCFPGSATGGPVVDAEHGDTGGTPAGKARMILPRSAAGSSASRIGSLRRPWASTASPLARALATQSPRANPPMM